MSLPKFLLCFIVLSLLSLSVYLLSPLLSNVLSLLVPYFCLYYLRLLSCSVSPCTLSLFHCSVSAITLCLLIVSPSVQCPVSASTIFLLMLSPAVELFCLSLHLVLVVVFTAVALFYLCCFSVLFLLGTYYIFVYGPGCCFFF
jgi:hypothetical protein